MNLTERLERKYGANSLLPIVEILLDHLEIASTRRVIPNVNNDEGYQVAIDRAREAKEKIEGMIK